jgi:hypothetical protein
MEIEIDIGSIDPLKLALVPAGIIILVVAFFLGRAYTPEDGSILTLAEWNAIKSERIYQEEIVELQRQVEDLVDLLNSNPNAVRAGILADQIQLRNQNGHPATALQRQAISDAAETIRLWSMGGASRDEARDRLNAAIALMTTTEGE